METDARLPVTVVTGRLGAGKTTLVNRILAGAEGRKLAVIVNEFGEIGVDGELIDSGAEDLVELSSGCVCCVVRRDLIQTLRDLPRRVSGLDGVVIETTGLANPGPVIQTFFADQMLAGRYRLDSVVTVADAAHMGARLADSADAADQIALADLILLNKAGAAGDIDALETALRRLNPFAEIARTERCAVDIGRVLDRRGFDLDRVAPRLDALPARAHDHVAANGIASLAVTCDAPLDPALLEAWLRDYLAIHGADMLRVKGVIHAADDPRKLAIQAVHMMLEGDFIHAWAPDEARVSRMVFIGRNLDAGALRAGLESAAIEPNN